MLEVIEHTDNPDIEFVYTSVLEQSHHHMQAFIKGLQQQGRSFTPTKISPEYFAEIV
ncbi:MAG: DUF2202 domain-containing protein [Candidatus Peribacteria bacterium]|nr:MAG: DUF2202 domain-containing protein [Candidatus Peribacteria bacterium]